MSSRICCSRGVYLGLCNKGFGEEIEGGEEEEESGRSWSFGTSFSWTEGLDRLVDGVRFCECGRARLENVVDGENETVEVIFGEALGWGDGGDVGKFCFEGGGRGFGEKKREITCCLGLPMESD